jgi:hypothetical protein
MVKGLMESASYEGQKLAIVQPKVLAVIKSGDPYIY